MDETSMTTPNPEGGWGTGGSKAETREQRPENNYRIVVTLEFDNPELQDQYGAAVEIRYEEGRPGTITMSSSNHGGVALEDDTFTTGFFQFASHVSQIGRGEPANSMEMNHLNSPMGVSPISFPRSSETGRFQYGPGDRY